MAFEKARQSLSDIENRLRNAFGLAGPIGASLIPDLSPVIIAGDLREPGHSFNRGRSFVYWSGLLSTAAASQYYSVRFDAAVLIESLYLPPMVPNGQQVTCYVTVPGQTPAQAITRASVGTWRDNKTADADVPPISDSGAATGALGGGTGVAQFRTLQIWCGVTPLGGVNTDQCERNMPIHLPAGSHLNWFVDMGALTMSEYSIGVWGRIWG